MYILLIKPFIDFFLALLGLVLLSPILILTILALSFANKGKPFFTQTRPGKEGKIFTIIKFKTMNDQKDDQGNLLPDAARLTYIGAFVRKTSIDEIPQLINVLKGEMSLIGPRPLLVRYLDLYTHDQNRRHLVRPGITGWAQVNGRNTISWEQKFEHDIWYVDNLTLSLDLKIIFMTLKKVCKGEGINADGQATTNPFKGNASLK